MLGSQCFPASAFGTCTSSREMRWVGPKPEEKGTNPPERSLSNILIGIYHHFPPKSLEIFLLSISLYALLSPPVEH